MNEFLIMEMNEDMLEQCVAVIREGFGTVAADFGLTQQNCPTNAKFMTRERIAAEMQKGNLMYGLYANGAIAGFVQTEKKSDARL